MVYQSSYKLKNDVKGATKFIRQTISACDAAGCSPLHNAVSRNHKAMAEALIEAGADVNIQDGLGMTPLMEAAFWDKIDFVKVILAAGANLDLEDSNGIFKTFLSLVLYSP